MTTPGNWRKSSYSDGDDGNDCVEIANSRSQVSVRDSKTPTQGTLAFTAEGFTTFLGALKKAPYSTVTDFAKLRG
ncbi:DUF397 domain-containing protein [Streptomyces sp. NPDC087844]|uniref:DUF397 domain-containing protein n=1 Tax=Streptomyces sp. NPDC087844 TaxID=3365805 RepID=UPI003803F228